MDLTTTAVFWLHSIYVQFIATDLLPSWISLQSITNSVKAPTVCSQYKSHLTNFFKYGLKNLTQNNKAN